MTKMTHTELLDYLREHEEYWTSLRATRWAKVPAFNALRSAIELHRLSIDMNGYGSCEHCSSIAYYNVPYPCPTIQGIQEELK